MKTTIEMHGYEIVISETEEGLLTVSAMKDGEVVEEFQLEGGEDHPGFEGEEEGEELKAFGDEEEDFPQAEEEEEEEEEEEDDDEMDGDDDEMDEMDEEEDETDEEETGKLESFKSFIRRKK
jgi:hypothetical protein